MLLVIIYPSSDSSFYYLDLVLGKYVQVRNAAMWLSREPCEERFHSIAISFANSSTTVQGILKAQLNSIPPSSFLILPRQAPLISPLGQHLKSNILSPEHRHHINTSIPPPRHCCFLNHTLFLPHPPFYFFGE